MKELNAYLFGGTALAMVLMVNCGANVDARRGTGGATSTTVGRMSVTAGAFSACALLTDGTIKCWGYRKPSIAVVPNITSATQVSCGDYHCCALLREGTIQCWGDNLSGQLGNGTTNTEDVTQPVLVSNISNATSVSAGMQYTCATLADGSVRCWGNNTGGILGVSTTTDTLSPVVVPGITGSVAVSMSSSKATGTCVLTAQGEVKCWGPDSALYTVYSSSTNPATMVGAGYNFECVLLSDATTRCWDSSTDLGHVDATIDSATYLTAGGFRHSCAIVTPGSVSCWGYNNMGQLGTPASTNTSTPTSVPGISTAIAVAAGYEFSCALLAEGQVKCWGSNSEGQLGDGTTTSTSVPVTVKGL